MPTKLTLLGIAAFALLLTACKDDTDVAPQRKFISFKMDNAVVLSEQVHRVFYSPGNLSDADPDNDHSEMLITGYTYNRDAINIRITSPYPTLTPGVYTNATYGTEMIMEMNPSLELIGADYNFGNLSVTIHEMKDSTVVGQFSGTLVSMNDGSLKQVTDGYFKLIYRNYP
ncbi:hypothetical protein GFS24_21600 [Chitinophaga sp. SYP-B3965]|uniref:hypothetical protein n=1 Tax=Chitinophaga sp. SYP-B3965 TaxID=2663120 RepID=UPI001299DC23|nr:hypothetical protein [Chitinophaga sp. SYP-B3965]MRG47733.1 hypothetical protein [Chitinophaga sp. SYP-B3965]